MTLPIEYQNLIARRALEVEMRPIRPGRNKPWLRFLREREYFTVRSRRPGQVLRFSDESTRGSDKMRQAFAWAFSKAFKAWSLRTFHPKARSPDPTTATCGRRRAER